jgi:acid phosphatase (class A)
MIDNETSGWYSVDRSFHSLKGVKERRTRMKYAARKWSVSFAIAAVLAVIALMTGCAGSGGMGQSSPVPEIRPGVLAGYLTAESLPNSLLLVPPPPSAGSAAMTNDEEVSRKGLALRGTTRWKLAAKDADLAFPQAAGTFSCALNAPITEQETPRLYVLLRRTRTDASLSTYSAKDHYRRVRPFMVNREPTCKPDDEKVLMKNGSYPSGHTTIGWTWALILSEIAPEKADAILARGRAFGEGRVVCNVHWQSDVTEGFVMGSATVARLHGNAAFRADLEAARADLEAVRAKGLRPQRDCTAEAAAMAR